MAHIRHCCQRPDGGLDGLAEIGRIHCSGNVERTEIAGNILAHMAVGQIGIEFTRFADLQDFRAEIAHADAAGDRIGAVHRVLEHDVGVTALELDFGDHLKEFARLDLLLADAAVGDHFVIFFADRNLGQRHAIDPLHIIGREQIHVLVVAGEFEGDVGDHHAERQRLDADFFVGVFALGIKEAHDVRVMGM
ncbi:hypothetical protein D3C72_1054840 [compost metagenome]